MIQHKPLCPHSRTGSRRTSRTVVQFALPFDSGHAAAADLYQAHFLEYSISSAYSFCINLPISQQPFIATNISEVGGEITIDLPTTTTSSIPKPLSIVVSVQESITWKFSSFFVDSEVLFFPNINLRRPGKVRTSGFHNSYGYIS